uniref:Uncharacterized protein n=1 Tax=Strigamia maritima TaxID=126957 RepID=T1IP62_STRMM
MRGVSPCVTPNVKFIYLNLTPDGRFRINNKIGANLLMENSNQLVNSASSDELHSSNLSTEEIEVKNRIRKKSIGKNGVHAKLTRTLKETRTNLINMDQMLVKFRGQSKMSEPVNFTGTRPRGRRTASVPPPLRISNCQLCGGDNSQQPRCQSVDNFETVNLIKSVKVPELSSRHSQSMQDLRIAPPSPLPVSKETPSFIPYPKMEESTGDALNSARGSEISLASATVEEMRSDIISLKNQLQKLELSGQIHSQHSLLYQQVEMKDRVISDMTQHLQDLSSKLEMSEEQRCQLLLKLEDTLRTSLDVGSEAEKFAAEVKRVEEMAAEVQADKDRLRRRARKIVLELKEKCKQYLSETQRLKDREWEMEQKCTQAMQENGVLARQITGLQERLQESIIEIQNFKTKADDIQQSSQRRDVELIELKAVHQEVQKTVQNHKDVNHKLVNNNEVLKNKVESLQNEKTT